MCAYFDYNLIKKACAILVSLIISVVSASWLLVALNTHIAHWVMVQVWDMPKPTERMLNEVVEGSYYAISADERISFLNVWARISFWRSINDAETFSVINAQKNIVVVSKFDAYYEVDAYMNEAFDIGSRVRVGRLEANYISYRECEDFLIFLPYSNPEYVIAFADEVAALNAITF